MSTISNMRFFFSVIIPVYNTQSYLRKTIDAVLAQGFSEKYEIILIDDGSTDSSGKICDEYAAAVPFIQVIHTSNKGHSSARNAGLDVAIGEYIIFLDSDDWLEADALNTFFQKLHRTKCELLSFQYKKVYPDGKFQAQFFSDDLSDGTYDVEYVLKKRNIGPEAWAFVYLRSFLQKNNLRFLKGIYHEDNLFVTQVCCAAKDIYLLNYHGYNYFQRIGSIMTETNVGHLKKRFEDLLLIREIILKLLEDFSRDSQKYSFLLKEANLKTQSAYWSLIFKQHPFGQIDEFAYKILNERKIFYAGGNISQKLVGFLSKCHFPLFLFRILSRLILFCPRLLVNIKRHYFVKDVK